MTYEFFEHARKMFTTELYGEKLEKYHPSSNPLLQQALAPKHIARVAQKYFAPRDAHTVRRLMLQRARVWGDAQVVSLSVLLELEAEQLRIAERAQEAETVVSKYQQLGAWRWVYNLQCWLQHRSQMSMPFFRDLLAHTKGRLGANVAHMFMFARWAFALHAVLALFALVIIVPSLWRTNTHHGSDLAGLLVGDGFMDTFFFYGGYQASYESNNWDMRAGYLLVLIVFIALSLAFIVASFSAHKLVAAAATASTLFAKDSPAGVLFSTFSFRQDSAASLHRDCTALLTRLRDVHAQSQARGLVLNAPENGVNSARVSVAADQRPRRAVCRGACDAWYWVFILTIILIAGCWIGIAALQWWAHNPTPTYPYGRLADWSSSPFRLLIVPVIAALIRRGLESVVYQLSFYEWDPKLYSSEHRHSRAGWRLVLLQAAFAALPVFFGYTAPAHQTYVPFIARPEAIALGLCSCAPDAVVDANGCSAGPSGADPYLCACDESLVGQLYYVMLAGELCVAFALNVVIPVLRLILAGLAGVCGGRATTRRLVQRWRRRVVPLVDMCCWQQRLALVWAGMAYAPVLPVLGAVGALLLFALELPLSLFVLSRPLAAHAYPAAQQQQQSRLGSLALLLLALVPVTVFLSSESRCGPYVQSAALNQSISENFSALVDQKMPRWVAVAFDYLTSAVVLWLVCLMLLVYVLTIAVQNRLLRQRKQLLELQLRAEEANKRVMISRAALSVGVAELEGRRLFDEWVATLPPEVARLHGILTRLCEGDFRMLLGMTREQLRAAVESQPVLRPHVSTLLRSVGHMRRYANAAKEKIQ